MAMIIDGKAEAERVRGEVRSRVEQIVASGRPTPGLRVVIVGDHPASRAYVRTKARVAREVGIDGQVIELPHSVTTDDLLAVVADINADRSVHGVLVQLPLPSKVDAGRIQRAIDPTKDVDGFHPLNLGRLASSPQPLAEPGLIPCTPLGCMHLLESVHGRDGLRGANAVVIGRSNIVGKPMAALLLAADCTVTVAHSKTRNLKRFTKSADIMVAAIGRPRMIGADYIRSGATIIDVGMNRIVDDGESRLVGDVFFGPVSRVAGAITPVPGGVGPMTVASLMRNTLTAYELQGVGG
ncbi:MAG: bifunctional 5,10-methylenetetrahydrofolate dehydrogenase/5,10-methenyltetrahydrofolate cyclohydrolase [Pseudomonadota bacterium]